MRPKDAAREVEDLRAVLHTPEGCRLIRRLLERTHVLGLSMTGNSQTFFLEGERSIGLYYLDLILEATPQELHTLLRTQNDRQSAGHD